jgi:hypothetical protein
MYHVRVTTSLLADAATICDGKFYIHGGGWNSISSASLPVTYPSFALALVINLKITELTGDPLEVILVDDEGSRILKVTGHLESGGAEKFPDKDSVDTPLALTFPGVVFQRTGVYTFKVFVAEKHIHSLDFSVLTP